MNITQYKPYPKYKSSGVEWIGEIPAGWEVNKIKFTSYVKGRVGWHGLRYDEFTDVGPFLVTGTDFLNGKINWETCHHFSEERYNEDPYIQLKENDLLITKDGTIGKVAIIEKLSGKASLNSGIMIIRPLKKHYMKEFMFWILNSILFSEYNEYTKAGSTIQHLYQETFEDFSFPIPSLLEQRAIADFLDRETARINGIIAKQTLMIELLKEKRLVLITQAVTKGLDHKAKMKPSCVEWIGEIPEEWAQRKLKFFSRLYNGRAYKEEELLQDGHTKILRVGNLFTNEDWYYSDLKLDSNKYIDKGDLIFAWSASFGPFIWEGERVIYHYHIWKIAFSKKLIRKRFLYYLLTDLTLKVKQDSHGSTMLHMTKQGLENYILSLPPLHEQDAIVEFLDCETAVNDMMVRKIEKQIELLNEYKQSLITHAVTGRIDIRGELNAQNP